MAEGQDRQDPPQALVAKIDAAMEGHREGERTRALAFILARDVSPNISPREILEICRICDAPLKDEPRTHIELHRVNASGAVVDASGEGGYEAAE